MKRSSRLFLVVIAVALITALVWEDVVRRDLYHSYRRALEARQHIEQQLNLAMSDQKRLAGELAQEKQHISELSVTLKAKEAQLSDTSMRLAEESRIVKELTSRTETLQRQIDQLQGELALAVKDKGAAAASRQDDVIELERIVLGDTEQNLRGRVISVDETWNFVVIDFGWDTVQIGDNVSIIRNGNILARARVERVQESICAATILPDWSVSDINVNDAVQVL